MRKHAEVLQVFELRADGATIAAIAQETTVSPTQVRRWLRAGRDMVLTSPMRVGQHRDHESCLAVSGVDRPAYAYLLGQYLGDGTIVRVGRTERLEIATTASWPGIRAEVRSAIEAVMARPAGARAERRGAVVVTSYGLHWPCLFPQHGPGRKHLRQIALEPWQQTIALDEYPGLLLPGLVHSDGWRGMNPVMKDGRRSAYSRYSFDNRSDDIRQLFCAACDRLDIAWSASGRWTIYVSRRCAVQRLDEFVGPKS